MQGTDRQQNHYILMYQYIKILVVRLSVCLSVRNGNGRVFSLKLFILRLQRAVRYVRHATVGACRRTTNRQEHKIIQCAEPERDTIFHLHVTACRGRGSHRQDARLAWVASRGQGTSCSSSFVSKVSLEEECSLARLGQVERARQTQQQASTPE